jgi:glycosyltransferase involved in cell wall biosynthesis
VSFDVAGVFEQIKDGYNGFIVPQGDWLSMADRLEQLIETPAKRREFGENSRKFVRQVFSSKQAGEKVLNTYKEILNLAESPCERNV